MARMIRYIRDSASGSQFGNDSFWQEFRVFDGADVSLSDAAAYTTPNFVVSGTLDAANMNDAISSGAQVSATSTANAVGAVSVMCDLGSLQNVAKVRICRYEGGIFVDTKTEVSADGLEWTTIWDSTVSGTFTEALPGTDRLVPDLPVASQHRMFLVF